MLKPKKPRLPDTKEEGIRKRPDVLVIAVDNFLEVIYLELEKHCELRHRYRRFSGSDDVIKHLEGIDALVLGPLRKDGLLQAIRRKRPDLLIVKLTVTAEHAKVEAGTGADDANYVALPFTRLGELGRILAEK